LLGGIILNSADVKGVITKAVDRQWDTELDLLRRLAREPSVRGNTNGVQRVVAEELRQLGLAVSDVQIDTASLKDLPGYSPVDWSYSGLNNVIGRLQTSGSAGRSLILNGHVDVVSPEPLEFWDVDPWAATIDGNRMIGRGTNDMKAGVTAMISALAAIRQCEVDLNGDVLIQSVIDEECSGNGTLACLAGGYIGDGAIIPEPFELSVVTASPGVLWCRIRIRGAGAHASRASDAVNAAEKAYVVIRALRDLEAEWNRADRRHPAFEDVDHPLNFNVGTIHAGDWPSTVPALCVIEARLSCFPGENLADVKAEVKDWILAAAEKDEWLSRTPPEVEFVGFHADGAVYDVSDELATTLISNHRKVRGDLPSLRPTTGTIDNRFFRVHYSIPTVCYGPIGGNTHAPNEWVDLHSVRDCTVVLAHTIVDWCRVS
jgi:acetylornithine deacetylase